MKPNTLTIEFFNQYGDNLYTTKLTNPRDVSTTNNNNRKRTDNPLAGIIFIIVIFIFGSLFGVFISNPRVAKCIRKFMKTSRRVESPTIELTTINTVHYSRMDMMEENNTPSTQIDRI